MNPLPGTDIEIRCFCSREPLLAVAGRDETGKPYVHMKVYKSKRLFGEMIATSGVVLLRCRDCFRWHRITIKSDVQVQETNLDLRMPV